MEKFKPPACDGVHEDEQVGDATDPRGKHPAKRGRTTTRTRSRTASAAGNLTRNAGRGEFAPVCGADEVSGLGHNNPGTLRGEMSCIMRGFPATETLRRRHAIPITTKNDCHASTDEGKTRVRLPPWLVAVRGATPMSMLSKDARDDYNRAKERLAARGCHPDDGERETEQWDYGL